MNNDTSKITYIMEKKLQDLNNRKAKEFYHNLLDEILEPILEVECIFLNPQLYPSYNYEDFEGFTKELITELKKVKHKKYKPLTMEQYLEQLENEL